MKPDGLDEFKTIFSQLPDVRLSPSDRQDVWNVVAQQLASEEPQPMPGGDEARSLFNIRTTRKTSTITKRRAHSEKRLRALYRPVLATVASVVLLIGGMVFYREHGAAFSSGTGNGLGPTAAATVNPQLYVFPDWDVLLTPTIGQPGKVDVEYYYTGPYPAKLNRMVVTNIAGSAQNAGKGNANGQDPSPINSPQVMSFAGQSGVISPDTAESRNPLSATGQGGLTLAQAKGRSTTLYMTVQGKSKSETIQLGGHSSIILTVLHQIHLTGTSNHWKADLVGRVVGNSSFTSGTKLDVLLHFTSAERPTGMVQVKLLEKKGYMGTEVAITQSGSAEIDTGMAWSAWQQSPITSIEVTWQGQSETIALKAGN